MDNSPTKCEQKKGVTLFPLSVYRVQKEGKIRRFLAFVEATQYAFDNGTAYVVPEFHLSALH